MSDRFDELLLQTLKEVGVRLERLEGRVDHIINEKADKTDVNDVKAGLKVVTEKLAPKSYKTNVNELQDELRSQGRHLDRIGTRIKTLQWMVTFGFAALGVLIAFLKPF